MNRIILEAYQSMVSDKKINWNDWSFINAKVGALSYVASYYIAFHKYIGYSYTEFRKWLWSVRSFLCKVSPF